MILLNWIVATKRKHTHTQQNENFVSTNAHNMTICCFFSNLSCVRSDAFDFSGAFLFFVFSFFFLSHTEFQNYRTQMAFLDTET